MWMEVRPGTPFPGHSGLRPSFALSSSSIGGWGTSRRALIENGLPGVGPYLGWWHSGGTSGWELCTLRTASWTPVLRGTSLGGIVYAKAGRWNIMVGYLSWHMTVCGEVAHTMSSRMVWVKCTTSAECKTIRIAASAVMDSWQAVPGFCQ
jgi:hypothetical protein